MSPHAGTTVRLSRGGRLGIVTIDRAIGLFLTSERMTAADLRANARRRAPQRSGL